ncbi:MAG: peptidoglycan-binding protein [Clostridia bacterium]|nr:peptidoglycan-binding protein [Clostridia bacterium]
MYYISDKASAVREVQRMLLIISQATDGISEVTVDGIYGDTTRLAVLEFQKISGLEQTAEVDLETFTLLFDKSEKILTEARVNAGVSDEEKYPLMTGDASGAVRRLNTELLSLTRYLPDMPRADVRGFFGRATEDAVKYFQNLVRAEADGKVSALLFDRIKNELSHREKFKGSA